MIGIVIVSHSRPLAEAVVELVQQVSVQQTPMAIAAGVGPERSEFGTDAVEISEAIQKVYSPDGVLVLMDLGSAILSAETALELLPPEYKSNIRFCAAPLVEGAIAAGVQAGLGSDLDTVCDEAQKALVPKIQHLVEAGEISAPQPMAELPESPAEAIQQVVLTLHNLHGLHARPAARFVQLAANFNADIRVRNLTSGKGPVSAKSLNALATLGAVKNDQILITASGAQATEALQALSRLVEENFGEIAQALEEAPRISMPTETLPSAENALKAVPISEGLALGPIYHYQPPPPPIPTEKATDPDKEWNRLQRAIEETQQAIRQRRRQLLQTLGEAQTAIFDAHLLILEDPELLEQVRQSIFYDRENAAAAWHKNITQIAKSYQAVDDPYIQQRYADVMDVGNQVLFALAGKPASTPIKFPKPVILFAQDITPTETAQLEMERVIGIITVGGGPTSHSAILARALGIPAVSGASLSLEKLPKDTLLAVDGFSGTIWVDPPEDIQSEIKQRRDAWIAQRKKLLQNSQEPAAMRDGRRIEVAANVGNVNDAKAAAENGAEGVGLLRTEFLFLTRETPPTEEEQIAALRQIGEVLGNRPIIVRTMDIGGDKELPYLQLPPEENPFLGVRAIRLSLQRPDLFLTQLRAILRSGADYYFRIMFPMVTNLDEVLQARRYLEQVHQMLEAENLPHRWPIETGIMIEVPAAALLSSALAPHVDFFSIGTNDLTQYTLAAERGNPQLYSFADALHPAILHLIQQVTASAHQYGKWVGICGELAGDPLATPILAGLGIDELSLNPAGIPRVKSIVRNLDQEMVKPLVEEALKAESAEAVRQIARSFMEEHHPIQ